MNCHKLRVKQSPARTFKKSKSKTALFQPNGSYQVQKTGRGGYKAQTQIHEQDCRAKSTGQRAKPKPNVHYRLSLEVKETRHSRFGDDSFFQQDADMTEKS
eukprot:scpid10089/ scgid26419/ 